MVVYRTSQVLHFNSSHFAYTLFTHITFDKLNLNKLPQLDDNYREGNSADTEEGDGILRRKPY